MNPNTQIKGHLEKNQSKQSNSLKIPTFSQTVSQQNRFQFDLSKI